ncbi:enolase C-terminal domain-like protein [Iodidimonas sp. SYSU 1G8]|uniref:mandelate racemase/muconate lactonizing enzyme family protein n=1 Tax=Iodidimonas sp. SYSU 1G8 TaxID=3133967 RepID=UPI0031FE90AA
MTDTTTIDRVEVWLVAIPYKSAMRSSRGTLDHGEKVILRIGTSDGASGLGEASVIFPGRSGESAGTVFVALRDIFAPVLLGRNPLHFNEIMAALNARCSEQYGFLGTLCAIDIALHDLIARRCGLSVADYLGGTRRTAMKLSRSLSILPEAQLVDVACRYAADGYPLLTLKGSADWRGDIAKYLAVRKAVPASTELEFDPNQAWTPKGALEVDHALADAGLVCIEQPCAWWDLDGMKFVTERARTGIAADESVLSPADAVQVVKRGAADMITVKLAKSGGIRNSVTILEIARAGGLTCNMGSKHTLGVGTAALLHFAAAFPDVGETIGYGDARERFVGDVIGQELAVSHGQAHLPEGLGLGVTLDEDALSRFGVQYHELRA